jgi:hypothetical protein
LTLWPEAWPAGVQALAPGAQTATLGSILGSTSASLAPTGVSLNGSPCKVTVLPARR